MSFYSICFKDHVLLFCRSFQEEQWTDKVEDLVTKYYETNVKKTPVVLSVKGLTEAVSRFITKKDTDAIECILK